jgi:glycosyltransferase involved in cell wall biosynthesis
MHKRNERFNDITSKLPALSLSKGLNVLLVVSSYLPNPGGLQTVVSQLAGELQKRGHRVSVVTQRHPRTLLEKEVINGVPVTRWHFLIPHFRDVLNRRVDLFLAGLVYFPLTLTRLLREIAREKPDVVNLHFVGAPAFFLLLARALMRFRFIVTLHGDDVEGLSRGVRFDHWVFRATLRRADAVTAPSRYLLEQAQTIEPSIADKARVIYNGIELPDADGKAADGFSIVSVGRLVPKKGFDIFLCALADVNSLEARLIGDGPERRALVELARELEIQDRVQFCGAQSHPEVMQAMAQSEMIVVPSRQEPFGMVALEAMALGKPVVASRVGGLPEVLEGADALLVEPEDSAALADAIRAMWERLEREPTFGARNRELAARFSVARMAGQYLALYFDGGKRL